MNNWLKVSQPRLGWFGTFFLPVFTAFVTPFSLDMYTPAIPQMVSYFDTDASLVNLTLVGFYVVFAVGQLVFGPLSDKWGRRPLFLVGATVYMVGSALCALAASIVLLIVMRVVQAIGAGALGSISMAMVKDVFKPERREAALSLLQAIFTIGPVVAPIVGAFLVSAFDWRMTFWMLACFGLVCIVLGLLMAETLPRDERVARTEGSVVGALGATLRDKGFTLYLVIAALFSLPFMAYVAVASYIYVDQFALSEMEYGMYFGVAMIAMAVGPFLWLLFSRFMSARSFTVLLMVGAGLVGVALLAIGWVSPLVFCVIFTIYVLLEASVRPFTANILFSQPGHDAGAVAALVNCSHTITGTVGMLVAVLPWITYLVGLGVIVVVTMCVAALLWFVLVRSNAQLAVIKEA